LVNVAQRFARALSELRVSRAYGLPGEDHMTLLDALQSEGIEYCTAYNESSAVIMAATDGLLTGRPGVAVLSLAPGISNAMNGVLHAYMEGLPVLVVSGQHSSAKLPFVVRQGFEIDQMLQPCTKWMTRVPAGADPARLVCKAADLALAVRPGPVYLELSDEVAVSDVPDELADDALALLRRELDAGSTSRPNLVAPAVVMDDLVARVRAAEHPVLVLGGRGDGVQTESLLRFAATCRVPVFTTSGQKGAVDSRSEFYAGTLLNGNMEAEVLSRADLILTVDFEAYDVYNRPWAYRCPTVSLSEEPLLEWFQPFDLRVRASPQDCLDQLTAQVGADGASRFTSENVLQYRRGLRAALLDDPDDGSGTSVARAVATTLTFCDQNTIVLADAGFSKPLVAMLSDTANPRHFLASNALSTMGFAIPAAIAAARASAGRVLAFMGDGSFLMRATELPIAKTAEVPPVFVVIVDRSLSQIEIKQSRRGLKTVGVNLPEISCRTWAQALGIRGADARTPDETSAALESAWDPDQAPLLLGIHVDASTSQRTYDLLRG
jgi:acetolactate synthase-1/2/3 large subunit